MATTTTIAHPKQGLWDGGMSPFKVSFGKLFMWLFLLSDAFTFSALLVSYGIGRFSYNAYEGVIKDFIPSVNYWPLPDQIFDAIPFFHGISLPLAFVGMMTFILIMSSITMVLAVEAGHRNHKEDAQKWMLWTILGGITFLSCQAWEWTHFIMGIDGVYASLSSNPYGPPLFADFFFFITGFHGSHVLSGVVINIIVYYNIVQGTYDRLGNYEMVEKVGLYWHFVDLVWVFVFTFFYLV